MSKETEEKILKRLLAIEKKLDTMIIKADTLEIKADKSFNLARAVSEKVLG